MPMEVDASLVWTTACDETSFGHGSMTGADGVSAGNGGRRACSALRLAHIFLHEVLDAWSVREVRPRMSGRTFLIRGADDCVIGCERGNDARQLMAVLPKRFARFGLTIHPTKTGLVSFRKPVSHGESGTGNGTFACLGLTHDWTKSRRGSWLITRQTASKRLRRAMTALGQWCRDQRHTPLQVQHRLFCQNLCGHDQYDGIRGNDPRLAPLSEHAEHAGRYWLSRRSRQSAMPWAKCDGLRARSPLPTPTPVHAICGRLRGSAVLRQSGAETLVTEEPDALIGHVRVCGVPGGQPSGLRGKRPPIAYAPASLRPLAAPEAWR